MPGLLTRLIGRDAVLGSVVKSLAHNRLVTLTGPPGIGKSTIALAVAAQVRERFPDGGRFVDLVPVVDPQLVPSALASVLGVSLSAEGTRGSLARALKGKRMLILLDNCEHVAAATALLVETVLHSCPGVTFLATSREPLRAQTERVTRLHPLTFPAEPSALTAAVALTFSAVELFVERATAAAAFELTDAEAPTVAELCKRLDGLPLAIELAAARVDSFGVYALAARLDDGLGLTMKGRRTALPRHQTLRGALDWSYQTLTIRQQLVLCRLAVFPAYFDAAAAAAVASAHDLLPAEVFEELTELVAKSLVASDMADSRIRYRLLASTRAYALEKLGQWGHHPGAARRHAEHARSRLREMVGAGISQPPQSVSTIPLSADRAGVLDDVRCALAWAHGPEGSPSLAIELTIAAVPFAAWFSLHSEFHGHVERAIELALKVRADSEQRARLLLALAGLALHTHGSTGGFCFQADALWKDLGAAREPDLSSRLELIEGLWAEAFGAGDYTAAVRVADSLLTKTRAISPLLEHERNSERLLGIGLHFAGDHASACLPLRRAYEHFSQMGTWRIYNPSQIDLRVSAGISLSRALWLLGESAAASQLADEILSRALRGQHDATICYTLGFLTCPLAFWRGDFPEASRAASRLAVQASRSGLQLWTSWARCYESALDSTKARRADWNTMQLEMLATLRDDFVSDDLLARFDEGHIGWSGPEVLRTQGERARRAGRDADAVAWFERSLTLAREQRSRFWELRAAVSLSRVWRDRGRRGQARNLLEPIVARQTDDVATLDLQRGRALLRDLG